MKRKKERRKIYTEKLHEKRARLRVHLPKELRESSKVGRRSILVNKGDTVEVMRGAHRGKSAKVQKVSHTKGKVYLEGITLRNARGVESLVPFPPSNLKMVSMKESAHRKGMVKGE